MLIRLRLILLSILCICINKYTVVDDIRSGVSAFINNISSNATYKISLYLNQVLNINKGSSGLLHENSVLKHQLDYYKKELKQTGINGNTTPNSDNYTLVEVNKNSALAYNNRLEVNYISSSGSTKLKAGQGVINTESAIGKTKLVSNSFAVVELLSSPDIKTYGQLAKSNDKLLLNGLGNGLFEVVNFNSTTKIQVGDVIETTGLDEIFPAHYAIAKVHEIRTENGLSNRIICKSTINFSDIDYLVVLQNAQL